MFFASLAEVCYFLTSSHGEGKSGCQFANIFPVLGNAGSVPKGQSTAGSDRTGGRPTGEFPPSDVISTRHTKPGLYRPLERRLDAAVTQGPRALE